MRTTLLGGLLDGARHNLARGAERVALFESGRAYLAEPAPTEGGAARGATSPAGSPPRCASRTASPGWSSARCDRHRG